MTQQGPGVAVIGSGVAGLTAAYVLQRRGPVTLFEADDRIGGHAHTHDLPGPDGTTLGVDTGFIVHNEATYPLLRRLFAELDVATQDSDMSMSVSCYSCGLEYAGGRGLSGLVPGPGVLARPRYLRMLTEVRRFHRQARALLESDGPEIGLAQFVAEGGFSTYFQQHFLTPVVSAVWSVAPSSAGEYPARYLFRFLANHGMLSVTGSPTWQTVVGGSGRYVEKVAKTLTAVHTSTPVRSVRRTTEGVEIRDDADTLHVVDSVVIATHPHQAVRMLAEPSALQTATLGAIEYSVNPTVLHGDRRVLPAAANAQASWNYRMATCEAGPSGAHVSYNMNRLQRLPGVQPYIVTLNDTGIIDPSTVIDRMTYEHPIYTQVSVAAQARLPEISDDRIAFAGAYHGWGFHEDGCRSGVEAAARLGVEW